MVLQELGTKIINALQKAKESSQVDNQVCNLSRFVRLSLH